MVKKNQSFISILITLITSVTFLILTLFLFEVFSWNVYYRNIITLIKVSILFGILNIIVQNISNFIMSFRLSNLISKVNNLNAKEISKFLFSKIAIEFILSSLMIWLSISIFSNEIKVEGIWSMLGIMVTTIVMKGIFSLIVSYHQNKEQLGGFR